MSTKRSRQPSKERSGVSAQSQADITAMVGQAIMLHRHGRFLEAETLYRQVLARNPSHFDAMHMLGLVQYQKNQLVDALSLLKTAVTIRPNEFGTYSNVGLVLHRLGQHQEALENFNKAISINPRFHEAYNNRGILLLDLNNYSAALSDFNKALSIRPDFAHALNNRGNALHKLGDMENALASFNDAIKLFPAYAEAHHNRGVVLKEMQRLEEALQSFDHAVKLYPAYTAALAKQAQVLRILGRREESLLAYQQQLQLLPDSPEILNDLANVLLELRRYEEALAYYDRALNILPNYHQAHNNRGNALQALGRLEEAIIAYDRAIALDNCYVEARVNRGNLQACMLKLDAALDEYGRALDIDHDNGDAHWNKAIVLLLQGNFAEGWAEYEYRWKCTGATPPRHAAAPEWRGVDNLSGKTILLYAEQGLGDTLQCIRFLKTVFALGVHILLEVPLETKRLLQPFADKAAIFAKGEPLPPFDYQCPLMSLPFALKANTEQDFASGVYLSAPASRIAHWNTVLEPVRSLRVGIVWRGNPKHHNDANRSIALDRFSPLLKSNACQFFGLQKDIKDTERTLLSNKACFTDLSMQLDDLAETAAVIAKLDLVITVDTALAHLAGSLGKPVWILVPFMPDFRWLLHRRDSPWYQSALLFRQPDPGNWEVVITDVCSELAALVESQKIQSTD
ncbi:MAG TPA: tetratricopeptide repeat protein [Burkholderiaceae bacterium]|jgi:tetratricopeptide (TPR) repeat protein